MPGPAEDRDSLIWEALSKFIRGADIEVMKWRDVTSNITAVFGRIDDVDLERFRSGIMDMVKAK